MVSKTERKRRYRELRDLGYSPKEASKLRDLGINNYISVVTTRFIAPNQSRTRTLKGFINFVNFDFKDNNNRRIPTSAIRGYLVTSKSYPLEYLIRVIKTLLPSGYNPINFEIGFERGTINYSELVVFRENEEIFKERLNL